MTVDHASAIGIDMATSNVQPETNASQPTNRKLQIARLHDRLEQLSQLLGTANNHSQRQEELNYTVTEDSRLTPDISESPVSSSNTDIPTNSPPLATLLEDALDKTSNLFTVSPPRSPGAEKQMSYNLNVNAKYHTHMDDAPARALALERALRAALLSVGGMEELVNECKVIISDLEKDCVPEKRTKYRRAEVVPAEDDEFVRQGGKVVGEGRAVDEWTLEERMKKADVKSEFFI